MICSRAVRRAILAKKSFFASTRLLRFGLQIFWYSSEICDEALCNGNRQAELPSRQAELPSRGREGAAVLHSRLYLTGCQHQPTVGHRESE